MLLFSTEVKTKKKELKKKLNRINKIGKLYLYNKDLYFAKILGYWKSYYKDKVHIS